MASDGKSSTYFEALNTCFKAINSLCIASFKAQSGLLRAKARRLPGVEVVEVDELVLSPVALPRVLLLRGLQSGPMAPGHGLKKGQAKAKEG